MLHARMPRVPDSQSTAAEKGDYALFLTLLFRTHRDILQIASPYKHVDPTAKKFSKKAATEATWLAIYEEFLRWRSVEIDAVAAPFLNKTQASPLPEPRLCSDRDGPARRTWWACLIAEKLRN